MSIASAITAAQGKVAAAYTAISNKGGTLPATQDLSNMPTAINSISTGGTISSLSVTPSTSAQTFTATGGIDGYSPVSVAAVTAAIDANITASNIKSGVSILGVPGSVNELNGTTTTITPTTSSQTVTPTSPNNGFTEVTVPAVTAAIDANIASGNIKSGVSILGVNGSVTELVGETRTVSLTGFGQTFTPTSGHNAITSITVNPANLARTVTPTTSSQSIGVASGFSGNGTITVNAVDSSIDANITAGNIKSGVSILGVTGTYSGGNSKYGVTIDSCLGNVDANGILQLPANTSGDIVFTGVKDMIGYALYYKFYGISGLTHGVSFPDLEEVSGSYACNSAFYTTHISSVSMPKLKTVSGANSLQAMFSLTNLTSISLPELETVSGNNGIRQMMHTCSYLTSVSMPKLKTVTGQYGIAYVFYNTKIVTLSLPELTTLNNAGAAQDICASCSLLETVSFPKLTDISGQSVFNYAFIGCQKLTDIYFNGLTTTSFGSYINQFNSMFNANTALTSGTCTVHFPSNLSSTISGLTGYPNFGGTSGRIVLAFDLTATS